MGKNEGSNISDTFKNKSTKKFLKNFLEQNGPGKKAESDKNLKNKLKEEQILKQNAINNALKEGGRFKKIVDDIFKKNEKLSNAKLPSQNEAIEILEKENEKEKDKNTRDTIEIIIQMIKDFFSKKFNTEEARKKIMETIKNDKALTSKTLDFLEKNPELKLLAKEILGENFVSYAKKNATLSISNDDNISKT